MARLHTRADQRIRSRRRSSARWSSTSDRIVAAVREVIAGVARPITRARASRGGVSAAIAASAPVATPKNGAAKTEASRVALAEGTPVKMPFGDLTVSEGRFVRWLKSVDQVVAAKETIAEIETDKALVEIESPAAGRLVQRIYDSGDVVKMGETIGVIG